MRVFKKIIFLFFILVFITSSSVCKSKEFIDPLSFIPEDVDFVFIIKNTGEFSTRFSKLVQRFDTSMGLLKLIEIWFGFDFTSPQSIKKNGFDPEKSLVIYSKGETLNILWGIDDEKKNYEAIKERLRRNGYNEKSKNFYSHKQDETFAIFGIKENVAFLTITSLNENEAKKMLTTFAKRVERPFIQTPVYGKLTKENIIFLAKTDKIFGSKFERGILGKALGNLYYAISPLFLNLGNFIGYIDIQNNSLFFNTLIINNISDFKKRDEKLSFHSHKFKEIPLILFTKIPKSTLLSIPPFLRSQILQNFSLSFLHPLLAGMDPFNDILKNIKDKIIIGISNFDDDIKPADLLNPYIKLKERIQKIHTFFYFEVDSMEEFLKSVAKVSMEGGGYIFTSKNFGSIIEFEIKGKDEEFTGLMKGEKIILVSGKGETKRSVKKIMDSVENFLNKNLSILYLEINPQIIAKKIRGKGFPQYYIKILSIINRINLHFYGKENYHFFSVNIVLK